MSAFQFILDENVDPILQDALHRQWPEIAVWIVGEPDAPPLSTLDPDILIWCEAHGFSLITNNRASMPVHLHDHLQAGRQVPGIFVLNARLSLQETVDEVALIWGAADPGEFQDRINYLPVSS